MLLLVNTYHSEMAGTWSSPRVRNPKLHRSSTISRMLHIKKLDRTRVREILKNEIQRSGETEPQAVAVTSPWIENRWEDAV